MTFRETLESKIDLAEDAVCRRSGELDRHLHELESRLKDLTAAVHRVRRESMSLGARSSSIVRAVEAFEAGTDLWEIREEAERITSLRGLIDGYERELAEGARPGPTPEYSQVPRVFAATR